MFLVCVVLQMFCITICATYHVISLLQYIVYFHISIFRSMCAVPNMAVFCSFVISCFPGMLLRYGLSNFEMVGVAPVITGLLLFLLLLLLLLLLVIC